MRADRLFSIVLLLQANHQLTSRDLASRLEVSERTIHRDMEALSGAGIPVVAARGIGGGWSLLGEYRTNLTGLSETEIRTLFVTKPSKLLADLKLEKAAEGALLKLLAALPATYRRAAERARQRIYVDVGGWVRREEAVPLLPVLQESIWLERKLEFTYERGPECESVKRVVDPLGLVAKGSVWYLVAGVDETIRSYRISRITHAELIDEPAIIPADFDLAAYWERSAAAFKSSLPNYNASFRVAPEIFPFLRLAGRFARVSNSYETEPGGWIRISVGFDVEEMACQYALAFGSKLEVIEPASLREKVIEAAREVVEFYKAEGRNH
jgi:predicted DNA-binding transcriptional regulator YafY